MSDHTHGHGQDHDHSHDHDHGHDHDHSHDHDHGHDHDHSHDHDHDHSHEAASPMSDKDKLTKLLEHWVGHNDDHANNYRQWAEKATAMGLSSAAGLISEAADLTDAISEKFRQAKKSIDGE